MRNLACIAALAGVGLVLTAFGAQADEGQPTPAPAPRVAEVVPAWKLVKVAGQRDAWRARYERKAVEVLTLRARLADRDRYRIEASRYRAEFLCIARHESHTTWTISTGNGYYGGLQMDRSFQRTYGPELYSVKGTADNWTADEQIAVASRAVPSRGFHPWPNTGRMCGLI